MADTRFPSFLRVTGSSSPLPANPQVERMIGVSDPYTLSRWRHGFEPRWDYDCQRLGTVRLGSDDRVSPSGLASCLSRSVNASIASRASKARFRRPTRI
jgi:hypothetical protein